MMYLFLALTGVLAVAVYILVIYRAVPGAAEERLGDLAPLPEDLGKWKADVDSEAGKTAHANHEIRELRTWLQPSSGLFSPGGLVEQARYRDAQTGDILRSDPDRRLKRRRVKK